MWSGQQQAQHEGDSGEADRPPERLVEGGRGQRRRTRMRAEVAESGIEDDGERSDTEWPADLLCDASDDASMRNLVMPKANVPPG